MFEVIAKYVPIYMRGTPQTMQSMTQYEDIVKEILFYFQKR
jgi:dihydropteroate synthase